MKTYCAIISLSWIFTILQTAFEMTLGHLTSPKYQSYAWMSFGLLITFVICGCNIRIWRKFQNAELTSQAQNRAARSRRLTKTLLFVSLLALFSWLPLITMDALQDIFGVSIPAGNFYFSVNLLNYSNSFLNPVVYALRIPEFRRSLVICCFKGKLAGNVKHTTRRRRHNTSSAKDTQLRTLRISHGHQ